MSVAELRNGDPARHGPEGLPRVVRGAPGAPAVPVPVAPGSGNGGDGVTGGGAGPSSSAAELYSQAVRFVSSATLGLPKFAHSCAPEPFLLLLERPG